MVLENGSSGASYGDDPSNPGFHPDTQDKQTQLRNDFNRLDYSRYTHPLPILGPLFGFNENRVRTMVAAEWLWARETLHRPLREEEEHALATAATSQIRVMSYAGPLGASAGLYRAYMTRSTWRLPFWSMGKDFDPKIVKVPGGGRFLQGESALMFWRVLRNGLYAANGTIFGMCIFLSLSASFVTAAIQRDPRLNDFKEALVAQGQQLRRERAGTRNPPRGPGRGDPTGQGQRSVGELWENHRRGVEEQQPDFNDASPNGGQGMDDAYTGYSNQGQASASSQETYGQTWSTSSRSARRTNQPPSSQSTFDQPSNSDFLGDMDGASPSASTARSGRSPSSQPPGGAWERLRRQASEGANQERPPPREPAAPRRESYSFSKGEENQQLAQSEAQKEFDAKVERERQGRDFNDREGRGRRW
jgi:hypothetical protein